MIVGQCAFNFTDVGFDVGDVAPLRVYLWLEDSNQRDDNADGGADSGDDFCHGEPSLSGAFEFRLPQPTLYFDGMLQGRILETISVTV